MKKLRNPSIEFFASAYGSGGCNPNNIKTSIETCDKDVAFIHELCSDNKSTTIAPRNLRLPHSRYNWFIIFGKGNL
jgi:hypothetical protein